MVKVTNPPWVEKHWNPNPPASARQRNGRTGRTLWHLDLPLTFLSVMATVSCALAVSTVETIHPWDPWGPGYESSGTVSGLIRLMVQKSQGQPPFGCIKACK